ncbi:hypothetical protein L227DRAFT_568543 [Lentinus tigrinus ALCF2SS1-6]|uniref:Uncharacterized protein n=1 Tax=Lentinus tigrinus ALCF2SS1-6 TaxID=1328759 RepID=A0A5C2RMH2_9APHY|nr:hypothetical protein L227DRAFT_568543 [Lentinus tigrinus ALCF2SS1-6]
MSDSTATLPKLLSGQNFHGVIPSASGARSVGFDCSSMMSLRFLHSRLGSRFKHICARLCSALRINVEALYSPDPFETRMLPPTVTDHDIVTLLGALPSSSELTVPDARQFAQAWDGLQAVGRGLRWWMETGDFTEELNFSPWTCPANDIAEDPEAGPISAVTLLLGSPSTPLCRSVRVHIVPLALGGVAPTCATKGTDTYTRSNHGGLQSSDLATGRGRLALAFDRSRTRINHVGDKRGSPFKLQELAQVRSQFSQCNEKNIEEFSLRDALLLPDKALLTNTGAELIHFLSSARVPYMHIDCDFKLYFDTEAPDNTWSPMSASFLRVSETQYNLKLTVENADTPARYVPIDRKFHFDCSEVTLEMWWTWAHEEAHVRFKDGESFRRFLRSLSVALDDQRKGNPGYRSPARGHGGKCTSVDAELLASLLWQTMTVQEREIQSPERLR